MNVGVLGLGLIGGSLARAYSKAGHRVFAADKDESMLCFAQISGVVTGNLNNDNISQCELIFLAIYSEACINWLQAHGQYIDPKTIVIDCCGIKKMVCDRCFAVANQYGFTFVGGHPMAGSHFSGFKYSRSNLFQGAPMVLVPPRFDDMALLQTVKDLLAPCSFGSFSVTTAEKHDEMIAFTSQMPHIISNAFIKSPTAGSHKGFSAGSYKDLTRVAWLNPQMWAELIMGNKDSIIREMTCYMDSLQAYLDAIKSDDCEKLVSLLDEGRRRKEEVDG